MTSDHSHPTQELVVSDTAVQAQAQEPATTVAHPTQGSVSPYSLVPALTLIALQFVKNDPNPFEAIILSIGGGKHRPTPEK